MQEHRRAVTTGFSAMQRVVDLLIDGDSGCIAISANIFGATLV
jgi:hypothetical protein